MSNDDNSTSSTNSTTVSYLSGYEVPVKVQGPKGIRDRIRARRLFRRNK